MRFVSAEHLLWTEHYVRRRRRSAVERFAPPLWAPSHFLGELEGHARSAGRGGVAASTAALRALWLGREQRNHNGNCTERHKHLGGTVTPRRLRRRRRH